MAKDVIKLRVLKGRDYPALSWWPPIIITSVSIRERERVTGPTQRRRPFEDRDRDYKLEKTRKYSLLEPWRECGPVDILILNLRPPKL